MHTSAKHEFVVGFQLQQSTVVQKVSSVNTEHSWQMPNAYPHARASSQLGLSSEAHVVGEVVGDNVGEVVGEAVGEAVGVAVGETVGVVVGAMVGLNVGAEVHTSATH